MKKIVFLSISIIFLFFMWPHSFTPPAQAYVARSNASNPLSVLGDLLRILFGGSNVTPPTNTGSPDLSITPSTSITPSADSTPTITPYPDSSSLSSVSKLVENIKTRCGGVVNKSNQSCVYSFEAPTDLAIPYLIEAANNPYTNYQLSCVYFAKAVGKMVDGINWGYPASWAKLLISSPPPGYRPILKSSGEAMIPGDYPIYNYDTYGHVAYAIEVYGSYGFKVAEGNWKRIGDAQYGRQDTFNNPYLIGWLRKL